MNSEVTLEQLRELKAAISAHSGKLVTKGNCTGFAIIAEEKRFTKLCEAYVRQLLTTPPASGEVVGVAARERAWEVLQSLRAFRYEADLSPDKCVPVSAMSFDIIIETIEQLSAAPKQAMGWRPIESAPRDGTLVLLGREPNEDGDNAISAPGRWDDALDDGVDYMGHDGGFNDCDFQLFSPGRSFGHEKYRYAPNQPTLWQPLPSPPEKAGG